MPQVTITYIAFVLWMSCSCLSVAQPLEIDTIETSNVESDHFKIRLPKVANIESYKILFSNYGVFTELEIEGEIQQFVGDYNNIQRTKVINQKIKKQGIEPTLITFFKQPVLEVAEVAVSQQAITGELTDKSLSFSRKILQLPSEVNQPAEETAEKKMNRTAKKVADQKELKITNKPTPNDTRLSKTEKNAFPSRPGIKNKSPEANQTTQITTSEIKETDSLNVSSEAADLPFLDDNLPEKLPDNGNFVLLLPLVDNPQVYQIVLNDLGYVQNVELLDGSLWYFFGFFDSEEKATAYIPQLNDRGFVKDMPIVQFETIQQKAQILYDAEKNIAEATKIDQVEKEQSVKPQPAKIDNTGDFFRIELPKVSNPEIFFKAFEDVGNAHSEIAPNGEAIYYIGAFESPEVAIDRLKDLEPRGLINGSIIRFSGKQRINPYRKDQIDQKKDINQQLKELMPAKKEPLIKTNSKGTYQIILGQVDNPEVFKDVFGDIGKIKVDYLDDETEFFYLGNYYVKEDAEFVVKQLKERGLTQMELIDTEPENTANIVQPVADKTKTPDEIEKIEDASKENNPSSNTTSTNPVDKSPVKAQSETNDSLDKSNNASNTITRYRILLGRLENPKFYQNILKEFGSITSTQEKQGKLYYLESFSTERVAQLVIEEIKALGIETPLEVETFKP